MPYPPAATRALAVVVTHENAATIATCLDAFAQALKLSSLTWEVRVVDNGSSDATVEVVKRLVAPLKAQGVTLTLASNPDNRGFAAAVNQAVAHSDAQHLLLLNPDCFVSEQALAVVEAAAERHPGDGFVIQLYDEDGEVQLSAGRIPWPSRLVRRWILRSPTGPYLNDSSPSLSLDDRLVEWAHFAFFFTDVASWRQLDGLDESYWLHGEDLDYCVRSSRAGKHVWWVPGAEATHLGGYSSRDDPWLTYRQARRGLRQFVRAEGRTGELVLLCVAAPFLACRFLLSRRMNRNRRAIPTSKTATPAGSHRSTG